MRCAQAGAVVAVKVFVEQNIIELVRVFLKLACAAVDWQASLRISQKTRVSRCASSCAIVAKPISRSPLPGKRMRNVFGACFGVLDDDVEIAIRVKDAGIEQLVFETLPVAAAVLVHQLRISKLRLWILVKKLHIRMRWLVVKIEVILLYVFAVIALASRQAKEAFFEDGIAAVPKGRREAKQLILIADASDGVFAPTIRLAACQFVR